MRKPRSRGIQWLRRGAGSGRLGHRAIINGSTAGETVNRLAGKYVRRRQNTCGTAGLQRLRSLSCGKGHTEPLRSDQYSGELVLTPLELINRIAQLVPPPRTHRHRYHGVLAPNSPLRAAVTAMAQVAVPMISCSPVTEAANADADAGTPVTAVGVAVAVGGPGAAAQPEPPAKPKSRPPSPCMQES